MAKQKRETVCIDREDFEQLMEVLEIRCEQWSSAASSFMHMPDFSEFTESDTDECRSMARMYSALYAKLDRLCSRRT